MRRWMSPSGCAAALLALALVAFATEAVALDGHRDRKGLFTGLGLGGGGAFVAGEGGGEAGFHAQLGGGAAQRVTFALDVDARAQLVNGATTWMLVPGPELDVFVIGSLFVSAGVGIAFVFPDETLPNGNDYTLAFDGGVGLGYEFFVGSNLALSLAVEGDYFAVDDADDAIAVGFWLGFRYY